MLQILPILPKLMERFMAEAVRKKTAKKSTGKKRGRPKKIQDPSVVAKAPKKRGRPKGSYAPRVLTYKFSINDAVDRFTELATMGEHPE